MNLGKWEEAEKCSEKVMTHFEENMDTKLPKVNAEFLKTTLEIWEKAKIHLDKQLSLPGSSLSPQTLQWSFKLINKMLNPIFYS